MQPSAQHQKSKITPSAASTDDSNDFFQPEFGKASPLRNPLVDQTALYNPLRGPPPRRHPASLSIDRRNGSRATPSGQPTFRLPARNVSSTSTGSTDDKLASFYLPGQKGTQSPPKDEALLRLQAEMKRPPQTRIDVPHNTAPRTTYAPTRPMFGSLDPPASAKTIPKYKPAAQSGSRAVPKDEDEPDDYDPDEAIRAEGTKFGSSDPYRYLDSEQANQTMKSLLEGAFDDDNEAKIKLKGRVKKAKKSAEQETQSLADKLSGLSVNSKVDASSKTADDAEEDDGTVEGMSIRLLPHQVDGVSWMISKESGGSKKSRPPRGGILADDMGLGKTVQSVALILLNPRPSLEAEKTFPEEKLPGKQVGKGTLVVAPLALIKQWEGEIQSKVAKSHALKVLVHHGSNRTKSAEQLKKYDVVITTYQILTSEYAASNLDRPDGPRIGCFGVHWFRIMLDEAHSIKNRNAKSSIACCALSSWNRWCLTGTPMQNNLDELQSLVKFLRIKPYCELTAWKEYITQPIKAGRGGLAMARLHHSLNRFMKRRTKDILKKEGALTFGGASSDQAGKPKESMQIVKREVTTIECEFDEQEQQFYDRLSDRAQEKIKDMFGEGGKTDYIGALVLLLRLRQACNHPALIEAAVSKDSDAINLGATPARASITSKAVDDMDDLAALMGGVTVQARDCDVCQFRLTPEQVQNGKTRCQICDQNIASMKDSRKAAASSATSRNRRVLLDSDDEDVLKPQQDSPSEEDRLSDSETPQPSQARSSKHQLSTKIRHILSILHSESPRHKIIVFSQFTSMLDIIQSHVRQRYVRYDGSMRPDEREAALNSLRNDAKTRILLCSLKCGSLGLNLTAASRVIIVEPFWNPFVEEQAIDRVHRLNQTVDVKVYRLIIGGSVEERILALQQRKRELAAAAIEGGKASNNLSMADVMDLFKPNASNVALYEKDREFTEKFGTDSRLIDGPSQSRTTSTIVGRDVRQIASKTRATEHEIYGRRW